jgi:molybdenum cofactor cytidylyltransferase
MPDPAAVEGSDAAKRRAFDDALLLIRRRLDLFVSLPVEKLSRLALEQRVRGIGDVGEPEPGGPAAVAGVLLAAGSSVRMGRNKLLLELAGESLIRRATRRAAAVLDPVVVVLGAEADRIRQELAGLAVRVVVNPEHARGMETSLRAGLAALPADAPAAVVLLADMPLVMSAMLAALVERFRATAAPLVLSQYGEAIAPPHLYARSLFAELTEAGSGKPVIDRHRREAEVLTWPPEALADLDVPADRERIEALLTADS